MQIEEGIEIEKDRERMKEMERNYLKYYGDAGLEELNAKYFEGLALRTGYQQMTEDRGEMLNKKIFIEPKYLHSFNQLFGSL